MTETCATCTLNLGEDYVLRPGSAGAPAPSVQLRIVDGDGQVLPPEQVGELEASGPNVARDYWKDETATSETFHDGWVRTGDLAYIDEDGFLFLVDRKKDIIIRGGENIYSAELEDALYAHPDVMDASVVGLPHATLGEVVGAVVQLRPGAQAGVAMDDDLRRHVGSKLAAFKVPAKIKFLTEPLPRNANGKILKSQLREMFEETPSDGQETGSADSTGNNAAIRMTGRLFSPSSARNSGVICDAWREFGPAAGRVLEIGSGTGQHAVTILKACPDLHWTASDFDTTNHTSIRAWAAHEGVSDRMEGPLSFDASASDARMGRGR